MDVLKVEIEGSVASFRYPHFVQGMQPTFEMPPPSTIYGLLCCAAGEVVARDRTRYAYHFRYTTRFEDYEHLHFFGKNPKMNPFVRELLFQPRLTLYLDDLSLAGAFRSPGYALTLGRAQDLMTVVSVQVLSTVQSDRAFFDGTLLTLDQAAQISGQSYAVTMPCFIDEARRPEWAQFAVLPAQERPPVYPDEDALYFEGNNEQWEVDLQQPHPYQSDIYRAIVWHSWSSDAIHQTRDP